jgi:hypothetical protein
MSLKESVLKALHKVGLLDNQQVQFGYYKIKQQHLVKLPNHLAFSQTKKRRREREQRLWVHTGTTGALCPRKDRGCGFSSQEAHVLCRNYPVALEGQQ